MCAFGISPDKFAISSDNYLNLKERKRSNLARESISRQSLSRSGSSARYSPKTIKIGNTKEKQQASKDRASKLAEERRKATEKRREDSNKRKFDAEEKEKDRNLKREIEAVKIAAKAQEPPKEPSISDLKIQDSINLLNSDKLTLEDDYSGKVIPVTNQEEAEEALRKRGAPPTHKAVQQALQEKYAVPENGLFSQEKYDKGFLNAKDIQRGEPGKTYRLGTFKDMSGGTAKPQPKMSGIFRKHPVTGEMYEWNPQDDSFHKVK